MKFGLSELGSRLIFIRKQLYSTPTCAIKQKEIAIPIGTPNSCKIIPLAVCTLWDWGWRREQTGHVSDLSSHGLSSQKLMRFSPSSIQCTQDFIAKYPVGGSPERGHSPAEGNLSMELCGKSLRSGKPGNRLGIQRGWEEKEDSRGEQGRVTSFSLLFCPFAFIFLMFCLSAANT